ncbi:MAG: hypothetical protein WC748_07255 [Legionellales bacterium]|jgi:hypothetical protein
MRKLIHILFFFSFAAQAQQMVTVPELEGGFTASVGGFYATPSTTNQNHNFSNDNINNNNADRQFGTQGSVGYIFDNSPNSVEISNRRIN